MRLEAWRVVRLLLKQLHSLCSSQRRCQACLNSPPRRAARCPLSAQVLSLMTFIGADDPAMTEDVMGLLEDLRTASEPLVHPCFDSAPGCASAVLPGAVAAAPVLRTACMQLWSPPRGLSPWLLQRRRSRRRRSAAGRCCCPRCRGGGWRRQEAATAAAGRSRSRASWRGWARCREIATHWNAVSSPLLSPGAQPPDHLCSDCQRLRRCCQTQTLAHAFGLRCWPGQPRLLAAVSESMQLSASRCSGGRWRRRRCQP